MERQGPGRPPGQQPDRAKPPDPRAWHNLDAEILQDIEDAVAFAQDSPFPELDTAVEDVFAD